MFRTITLAAAVCLLPFCSLAQTATRIVQGVAFPATNGNKGGTHEQANEIRHSRHCFYRLGNRAERNRND